MTNPAVQASALFRRAWQLGTRVTDPLAGPLFLERMHADGATLSMAGNRMTSSSPRGQFVAAGTCVVLPEIAAGESVMADFGAFGTVRARFQA